MNNSRTVYLLGGPDLARTVERSRTIQVQVHSKSLKAVLTFIFLAGERLISRSAHSGEVAGRRQGLLSHCTTTPC